MTSRRSDGRYVLYASGLVALAVLLGCTPPEPQDDAVPVEAEAVIEVLRNEPIIEFTPGGVEDRGLVELPAEGTDPTSWISRKFVAPSDEALLSACAAYYQAALAEGWEGAAPADTNSSGIVWTLLTKGDMELDISCATSQSADLMESDRDETRMTVRLSTSSTSGLPADGSES